MQKYPLYSVCNILHFDLSVYFNASTKNLISKWIAWSELHSLNLLMQNALHLNPVITKSVGEQKNFAITRISLSQNNTIHIGERSAKGNFNAKIHLFCFVDICHVQNAYIFLRNAASCPLRHRHCAFWTPELCRRRPTHPVRWQTPPQGLCPVPRCHRFRAHCLRWPCRPTCSWTCGNPCCTIHHAVPTAARNTLQKQHHMNCAQYTKRNHVVKCSPNHATASPSQWCACVWCRTVSTAREVSKVHGKLRWCGNHLTQRDTRSKHRNMLNLADDGVRWCRHGNHSCSVAVKLHVH